VEQACLRAQGYPHDYAIRQELLSALEWEASLHPEHARALIKDLFKEVQDGSTELLMRVERNNVQGAALPIAQIQTLRQRLAKLLHVLATRHLV
jgi:hypothetical protein